MRSAIKATATDYNFKLKDCAAEEIYIDNTVALCYNKRIERLFIGSTSVEEKLVLMLYGCAL